uniref:Uncharacterized protein n=1 Tax=Oncorhynchus mykiss TaxID=8022 RepID=A0A8K9UCH5_ONCMY
DNLTEEKDHLQTLYNTRTNDKDQLQISYNTLTKEIDQLQISYNTLTKERYQLQISYNTLTKERDQLQISYNTRTNDKDQLQISYNTLTKERDQLHTSYNNLTKERDQLQRKRDDFEGWFYISTKTKNWTDSRSDCTNRALRPHLSILLLPNPSFVYTLFCPYFSTISVCFTAETANRTGGTFTARATNNSRFTSSFPANISMVTGGGAANSTVTDFTTLQCGLPGVSSKGPGFWSRSTVLNAPTVWFRYCSLSDTRPRNRFSVQSHIGKSD